MGNLTAGGVSGVGGVGGDTFSPFIQYVLPNTLPVVTLTPQELHVTRYGITQQDLPASHRAVITVEMQQMEQWFKEPIQIDREDWPLLADSTWKGYLSEYHRFFGYCTQYHGIEQPTLHHMLNGNLVLHFISFLRARGVQPAQLYQIAHLARRATFYLQQTNRLSPTCKSRVEWYMKWLKSLAYQCKNNLQPLPKPTLAELQEQGQWMQPVEMLKCIVRVHEEAVGLVASSPSSNYSALQHKHCVTIMECLLCCFFYGFVPPMRPSILITLLLPGTQGCNWPSCQHKDRCKGNRLEWVYPEGATTSNPNNPLVQVRLVAPHHKTRPNGKEQPIDFLLPKELLVLAKFHLLKGLRIIQQHLSYGDDEHTFPSTVFLWHSTGKVVQPQQVSQLWRRRVLPPGFKFGPQVGRAAFCTLVRDDAEASGLPVAGLDEDGAAVVMGNSITMWDTVYDRDFRQRRAQVVVDQMASWRQAVLARAGNAAGGQQAAPPAAVHAGDVPGAGVIGGTALDTTGIESDVECIDLVSDSVCTSESEPESTSEEEAEMVSEEETEAEDYSSGSEGMNEPESEYDSVSESGMEDDAEGADVADSPTSRVCVVQ